MDSDYYNTSHIQIRWKKPLALLHECQTFKLALYIGDLDCTSFTNKLESFFDCPFDNTTIDLDE